MIAWILLAALGCTGPTDEATADTADTADAADTDTDTDTHTDTDTDTDLPAGFGFDFDTAWYPLTEAAMFCQEVGALYNFSAGALRDGTGEQGNAYAYFGDVPTPGTYTLVRFDYAVTELPPGEGAIGFIDYRESTFWWSDGTAGTLEVRDAGGGALDVIWADASLHNGAGGVRTSTQGWLRCTP